MNTSLKILTIATATSLSAGHLGFAQNSNANQVSFKTEFVQSSSAGNPNYIKDKMASMRSRGAAASAVRKAAIDASRATGSQLETAKANLLAVLAAAITAYPESSERFTRDAIVRARATSVFVGQITRAALKAIPSTAPANTADLVIKGAKRAAPLYVNMIDAVARFEKTGVTEIVTVDGGRETIEVAGNDISLIVNSQPPVPVS